MWSTHSHNRMVGVARRGRGQPANKSTSAPGRVEGGSDVLSLGTSATGTVAELLVKAGDRVQAGQTPRAGGVPQYRARARGPRVGSLRHPKRCLPESRTLSARGNRNRGRKRQSCGKRDCTRRRSNSQRPRTLHEGVTVTRVQIDQAERDARDCSRYARGGTCKAHLLKVGSREEDIAEARSAARCTKGRVERSGLRAWLLHGGRADQRHHLEHPR